MENKEFEKLVIPIEIVNEIVTYLLGQPAREVMGMLKDIQEKSTPMSETEFDTLKSEVEGKAKAETNIT